MAQTRATIDGKNTLAEIESRISGEEALASRFANSQINTANQVVVNEVVFDEVDKVPSAIKLALAGEAAPPGFSKEWSGPMVVSGSNKVVVLYRKDA